MHRGNLPSREPFAISFVLKKLAILLVLACVVPVLIKNLRARIKLLRCAIYQATKATSRANIADVVVSEDFTLLIMITLDRVKLVTLVEAAITTLHEAVGTRGYPAML